VNYSYKREYTSEESLLAKDEKYDQWYESNVDFSLKTVKYKSVYLKVNNILLTENQDYEIVYLEGLIKFRFLTELENRASIFKTYPTSKDKITIRYSYTPDLLSTNKITKHLLDMSSKVHINDEWAVNSELVVEQYNFSQASEKGSSTFKGTGQTNERYTLTNTNLVENSEIVKINNQLLTKDLDYWINYEKGQIIFINKNPSSSDTIFIEYQYFTFKAIQSANKQSYAYNIYSDYTLDNFKTYGNVKVLDKEFLPISELTETKGTKLLQAGLAYDLTPSDNLSMDYKVKSVYKTKKDNGEDSNLISNELSAQSNASLWIFKTKQDFNYNTEIQDPYNLKTNEHDIDSQKMSYLSQATFGTDYLTTTLSGKYYKETSDFIDKTQLENKLTRSLGIKSNLDLKIISLTPYYYYSHELIESIVSTNAGIEKINNYGISNEISFESFKAKFDYDIQDINKNDYKTKLTNSSSQLNFIPLEGINLGYNYTHLEERSPLMFQKGKTEDQTSYLIKKLDPYALTRLDSFKGSSFYSKWNTIGSKDNNDLKVSKYNSEVYEYKSFQPIKEITINKISFEKNKMNINSLVQTDSVSSNSSESNFQRIENDLIVEPYPNLSYSLALSDKQEGKLNNWLTQVTNNCETRTIPEFNRKQKLNFSYWFFKNSIQEDYLDSQDLLLNTASSNYEITSKNIIDNKNVKTLIYETEMEISSFNVKMTCKDNWKLGWEYYNRNINEELQGSIYKKTIEFDINSAYKINSQLSVVGLFNQNFLVQYSSDLNLEKESLVDKYSDLLNITKTKKGGELIFGQNFFDFKSGIYLLDIEQGFQIHQDILLMGIGYKPFNGTLLSGDYSFKRILEDSSVKGYSNSILFKFVCVPPISKQYIVNINTSCEYTKGQDLNNLDIDSSLQKNQKSIQWQIKERNDIQLVGNLSINAEVPMEVGKLILSVTGKYKMIKDFNYEENCYNISGILFSGKMVF
jgi:hypothetical protein